MTGNVSLMVENIIEIKSGAKTIVYKSLITHHTFKKDMLIRLIKMKKCY